MRNEILISVRSRDSTTFQDLAKDVSGFRGDFGMFNPERPEIVVWHACSEEGIAALADLMGSRQIRMEVAPRSCYVDDGDLPPLPICRSTEIFDLPSGDEVWFPVVFVEYYEGPQLRLREDRFA